MKVISTHNFISSSGSGTVINYGSGSDFLTSYGSGSGSGSTSQKVTVPTVPVPVQVPQHWAIEKPAETEKQAACLLFRLGGISSCWLLSGLADELSFRSS